MKDEPSSLEISQKREKNAQRRQIFSWLARLYEAGLAWEPNLDLRRRKFIYQIRMKRKELGREETRNDL
jgi:hypothetical protein